MLAVLPPTQAFPADAQPHVDPYSLSSPPFPAFHSLNTPLQDQPSFVRTNLARVNEDVLDMDLLEDLVGHVDDTIEPGAILVFLPGEWSEEQRLQAYSARILTASMPSVHGPCMLQDRQRNVLTAYLDMVTTGGCL
jgi:hypothetical protein